MRIDTEYEWEDDSYIAIGDHPGEYEVDNRVKVEVDENGNVVVTHYMSNARKKQ